MSEFSKTYDPGPVEKKWYQNWLDNSYFHSTPDQRESYSVVIPPPNVTGVLHMGHMLNNTIQDVLVRRARLLGKNACWVPGTDHASIATEAKVVQHLRKQGIRKSDLGRDEFLKHAWEWKEKHGGIILEQLKKLGASCDWNRTTFTMDDHYHKAVIKVFVDLYRKGLIYRDLRMVNWDVEAKTTISNEEVIYREEGEQAEFYSVRYAIKDSDESLVIATVRPETIMGDTAIAVHPDDERFKHLIGRKAIVPLVGREIPIIADEYVDREFGTGCLKVTPAHDPNDYEIGKRHDLQVIDILNDDGTLNEKCELPDLVGTERFEGRKKVIELLKESGQLIKTETITTRIGRSERTDSVVEPKLSLQWFINMKGISKKALDAVVSQEVKLHPSKFLNTYRHWIENVRDWCISRQLWWGQQIPAYYLPDGDYVVAESREEALQLARKKIPDITDDQLSQDEDVLDTWASSWLWPIQVFHGFDGHLQSSGSIEQKNEELAYYYPTAVLVTAPEILYLWVARMIIAGYEYLGEKPFSDVYLHGIVRDKQGRKMSKSLGNSPDPIALIDEYSADGVRMGMLFSAPAGNDILFDVSQCEQGRNFANKIWNAARLVDGWESEEKQLPRENGFAIEWFRQHLALSVAQIDQDFEDFRISEALKKVYKLFWDDFCSWYLEMVKPAYGEKTDSQTIQSTKEFFNQLLVLLHPFMPFITEEVWHRLNDKEDETIQFESWPNSNAQQSSLEEEFDLLQNLVVAIRNLRAKLNIPPSKGIDVTIHTDSEKSARIVSHVEPLLVKLCRIEHMAAGTDLQKPERSSSAVSKGQTVYVKLDGVIDLDEERNRAEKELQRYIGFLKAVEGKLSNERFVQNAPAAVVDRERQKQADALQNIEKLKAVLQELS